MSDSESPEKNETLLEKSQKVITQAKENITTGLTKTGNKIRSLVTPKTNHEKEEKPKKRTGGSATQGLWDHEDE